MMDSWQMLRTIRSPDNTGFAAWSKLRQARLAKKANLMLLEGMRQVRDVLAADPENSTLIFCDDARGQQAHRHFQEIGLLPSGHIQAVRLKDSLFARLCETKSPQEVLAVVPAPPFGEPAAKAQSGGRYLVCEEIQDPGNLGTLIRTADAFALDGVLLTAGCVWPFNSKVLRAAMGSVFHLPLYSFATIESLAHWLKGGQVPLLAADLSGVELTDYPKPAAGFALLIGNEGRGLSEAACRLADHRLAIPMPGRAESLNAAIAAAIFCYVLTQP